MKDMQSLLTEKEIEKASFALAKAFMNDPLQTYVFPDPEERARKSPAHFEAVLRYGVMFGEVYGTEDLSGAVVWLNPGNTAVSPEKAELAGLDKLPELLGNDAAQRFFEVMDFLDPYHLGDIPEPHWYTLVIGVDPSFMGKGVGRSLMATGLERAAASKLPAYLETAAPTNVRFYEGLRFKVVRELIEPTSRLPLWTFRKDF